MSRPHSDQPFPLALLAWPFLWLYGTLRELFRPKVELPPVTVQAIDGTFEIGGVTFPWNATSAEVNAGLSDKFPAIYVSADPWELPEDPFDPSDWWDGSTEWKDWARANGYVHTGDAYGSKVWTKPFPHYADRDYE